MSEQFQVTAECAHVTTARDGVRTQVLMYKGAFLPEGVDAEQLKFLVDGGLVSKVGDVPLAPNASVEQDPRTGADSVTPERLQGKSDADIAAARAEEAEAAQQSKADAEVEERRAAARRKLAEIGGKPDGRSSEAVMVEYLVANGYDRGEVEKADKGELKNLVSSVK